MGCYYFQGTVEKYCDFDCLNLVVHVFGFILLATDESVDIEYSVQYNSKPHISFFLVF